MPKAEFPSVALEITPQKMGLEKLAHRLRAQETAVVGYVHEDRLLLNLRSVFTDQDAPLIEAVRGALQP